MKIFFKKLLVILYKNLLLRRTQWLVTTLELILPISFVALACAKFPIWERECYERGTTVDSQNVLIKSYAWWRLSPESISYSPLNPETEEVMKRLQYSFGSVVYGGITLNPYIDEITLRNELRNVHEIGIVFPDGLAPLKGNLRGNLTNAVISYKIVMHASLLPSTKKVLPTQKLGDKDFTAPENGGPYSDTNFLKIQLSIDEILAEMITGRNFTYDVNLETFPYYKPSERFHRPGSELNPLIAIFLSLSILFMIPTITRNVTSEKDTGISELLKSAGVSGEIQWLGWMINSLVPMLFAISVCTILLFSRLAGKDDNSKCEYKAILEHSDWTLVWVLLFLYILSTIAFCFFICSLIKKPTISTTIAVIISVSSTFLFLLPVNKLALSILPNCAMSFGFILVAALDRTILDDSGIPLGAKWNWELLNFSFTDINVLLIGDITLLQVIMMMIGNILVYSLLALYLENVLPSEHGVRRPWYIFNFLGKWFNKIIRRWKKLGPIEMVTLIDEVDGNYEWDEDRPTPVGIEVENLCKKFGRKMAVNGVTLKMYCGDIFCLLGHNGAGKTTLISMITGFFPPSRGTAVVEGFDIRFDMGKARQHMGVCPQHNMLFDNMTVISQLIIFGMLRGMSYKNAKNEGEALLGKMKLSEKVSILAKNLSGGQKRKLSLAMALIGGTKVVILDEPTSGMDPQARREIWDLLLELRGEGEGRTMLLTTHFMEEADVLGDRIGIMAAGKLQCCGSSQFLKKYYGTGFTLKVTLHEEMSMLAPVTQVIGKILNLVKHCVSGASIKKDARSDANCNEVFLSLPTETATTSALTAMFTELTRNKDNLGIKYVGLQQTTMDEVFLRVGKIVEEDKRAAEQNYEWTEDDFDKPPKLTGIQRLIWQFIALLIKKWILFKRKWILITIETVIPLLLITGAILILQSGAKERLNRVRIKDDYWNAPQDAGESEPDPQPELLISLVNYQSPITYYSISNNPSLESYAKIFTEKSTTIPITDPEKLKQQLIEMSKSNTKKFKRHIIASVSTTSTNSSKTITGMFNAYPYHSAPLALNIATNIALRALSPSRNNTIQVINHPWVRLPNKNTSFSSIHRRSILNEPMAVLGETQSNGKPQCQQLREFLDPKNAASATIILLAFILFVSPFITGPIQEKICGSKQLQIMTGLQPVTYWTAHFLWDYTVYFVLVLLSILLVLLIELPGYQYLSAGVHGAGVLFLILMCYGFSSLALVYLLSLRSTTVAGGFALVTLIHLLTGIILGIPILPIDESSREDLGYFILIGIKIFGYFFPSMPTLRALARYMYIAKSNMICIFENTDKDSPVVPLPYIVWSTQRNIRGINVEMAGVGQELFFVMLLGVIYVGALMAVEYKLFRKICGGGGTPPQFPQNVLDDDVQQEKERVNALIQNGEVGTECMVIQNLSKVFGDFAAVGQVSVGVHYGECFGLLGVNGAGKTTVFKMITGEEFPTQGIAYSFGTSTVENGRLFFSNIGYCPQFDAILDKLSGREMLELFGVLRGLPRGDARMEAEKWLQRFGLGESGNLQCGRYSGGMKRRLSTTMAMIGDPGLLLLDEPTSGVDPVSRHQFWKILGKIRDGGQSIILTSHSMDECEALCSRLGIMVNGQFQCFGGVEHLKTKFAQGYSLTFKLKHNGEQLGGREEILRNFERKINERFDPCVLKDKHQNLVQYHLQNANISWEVLFKMLEGVKEEFQEIIEDYSVNETSLEEVFLSFAKKQYEREERQVEIGVCARICICRC